VGEGVVGFRADVLRSQANFGPGHHPRPVTCFKVRSVGIDVEEAPAETPAQTQNNWLEAALRGKKGGVDIHFRMKGILHLKGGSKTAIFIFPRGVSHALRR